MFIWFWEQMWTFDAMDAAKHNFETEEVGRCFCDQWHYDNRGLYYPTKWMVEGVDWIDY